MTEPDRMVDFTPNPPSHDVDILIVLFSTCSNTGTLTHLKLADSFAAIAKGNYATIFDHLRVIDWDSEQVQRNVDDYNNFINNAL